MKAVFLDFATMGPGLNTDTLRTLLPQLEVFDLTATSEIDTRIRHAEIVLTNKVRLTERLLQDNPQLRFVGLTATGTDNIDLAAAKKNAVAVSNIRGYCSQSIAEHVFGCLLSLAHSLRQYDLSVRAGNWQRASSFCVLEHPVRELSAMTLGIVGYGELGRSVARIASAFRMKVIVAARRGDKSIADDRVAFDELLGVADVISLHCPLNEATVGMFGAPQFAMMKSDAILINTARGGLVDSAALVAALRNGDITAAAIDVLAQEPPVDGDPLLDYEGANLIITPHIAWATREARQGAIEELAANVAAFLDGRNRNRVA
jgi:glycerate dehydrogenase